MSRWMFKYTVIAMVGLFLTCQAFAHAHLVAATPPAGGTVAASPLELDLKFSEALDVKFSGVKLTGPDNAEIKLDGAMLTDNDQTLMVTVPTQLAPGVYTVDWQALSKDGHKTHGTYTFTVKL
jgi:copper resistance protein C